MTKPAGPLVKQFEALSDEVDLVDFGIGRDFGGGAKEFFGSLTSLVIADEDESMEKVDRPVTFANSVQMFKVESTDDASSDLEFGEIE